MRWHYCHNVCITNVGVWEHIVVYVHKHIWRSVQECVDSLFWSITVSHSVVFRPSAFDCNWICWKHLFIILSPFPWLYCLSPLVCSLSSSYNLPPSSLCVQVCVWERGQQADTHYQQVQPVWWRSIRVRGWGGEELHGGFRQRYMSHRLWRNPSFRRESIFYIFSFPARFSKWCHLSVERLDSSLPFQRLVCHLFISMLLCHTVACCSLLSARSFLMSRWRVLLIVMYHCCCAVLLCCTYWCAVTFLRIWLICVFLKATLITVHLKY